MKDIGAIPFVVRIDGLPVPVSDIQLGDFIVAGNDVTYIVTEFDRDTGKGKAQVNISYYLPIEFPVTGTSE